MNYLMCSVGRRGELMKFFRQSMEPGSRLVATDNSPYAPALYYADRQVLVPRIDAPEYVDTLLDLCEKEKIRAVTTFIDPEIMLLARNRERFEALGVEVLAPYTETAELCFDKYEMFRFLKAHGIRTPRTWGTCGEALSAVSRGEVAFPLFVKPRRGSGSVGARRVENEESLRAAFDLDSSLIAQELMTGEGCFDLDADIYVDTLSHEPVSVFAKRKISTTIGGANKTISFKDDRLFAFVAEALKPFRFNGPIDADFFYKDGEYWLSEVNPRFGGAYLHAYGAGVDFIKLIENNLHGRRNAPEIGNYPEDVVMMMYDSVVIARKTDAPVLEVIRS